MLTVSLGLDVGCIRKTDGSKDLILELCFWHYPLHTRSTFLAMRYVCLASLRFRTDESTLSRFPLCALAYRYYNNDRHPAGRESFLNGEPSTCASDNPVTELLYWEELKPTRTPSQRIIQVAITAGARFPSAIKRSLALLSCHHPRGTLPGGAVA